MDAWERFNQNLLAVHGGSFIGPLTARAGNGDLSVRHAELVAMADAFLGKDYDPAKLEKVGSLQAQAQQTQAALFKRYQQQEIDAKKYVSLVNKVIANTFEQVESVLGCGDFVKLFGVPRGEVSGFIDLAAFEAANAVTEEEQKSATVEEKPDVLQVVRYRLRARKSRTTTVTSETLAVKIAATYRVSRKQSEAIVNDVISQLVKNLRSGAPVQLAGLGVVQVKTRSAKMKRNATSGQTFSTKGSKVAAYHAAKKKAVYHATTKKKTAAIHATKKKPAAYHATKKS